MLVVDLRCRPWKTSAVRGKGGLSSADILWTRGGGRGKGVLQMRTSAIFVA